MYRSRQYARVFHRESDSAGFWNCPLVPAYRYDHLHSLEKVSFHLSAFDNNYETTESFLASLAFLSVTYVFGCFLICHLQLSFVLRRRRRRDLEEDAALTYSNPTYRRSSSEHVNIERKARPWRLFRYDKNEASGILHFSWYRIVVSHRIVSYIVCSLFLQPINVWP